MTYRSTPCSICGEEVAASRCPRCEQPLCETCADKRGDEAWQTYEAAVVEHAEDLRDFRRRSARRFVLYLAPAPLFGGWLFLTEDQPDLRMVMFWIGTVLWALVGLIFWWGKNILHSRPPNPEIFNLTPCSEECKPAAPPKLRRPVSRVLKP